MRFINYLIILAILSSCGKPTPENPSQQPLFKGVLGELEATEEGNGQLLLTLNIKPHSHHVFLFKVIQVILVDSLSNTPTTITIPSNVIQVNYNAYESQAILLAINKHVPAGVYDRVIVTLSLDNPLITASNQPTLSLPLVDAVLSRIPDNRSSFTVETLLEPSAAITVEPTSMQQVSLSLDMNMSTKYVPLADGQLGVMFTPVIQVEKLDVNRWHLFGELSAVSEKYLQLYHPYKVKMGKAKYVMNYAYEALEQRDIIVQGERRDHLPLASESYWSLFDAAFQQTEAGFSLALERAFLIPKTSSLKLFEGVVVGTVDNKVRLSGLYLDEGYSGYPIQRKITNKTFSYSDEISVFTEQTDLDRVKWTVGQRVWAAVDTSALTIASAYLFPSLVTGTYQVIEGKAQLDPLAYNHIDSLSENFRQFFPAPLIIASKKAGLHDKDLLNLAGYEIDAESPTFVTLTADKVNKSSEITWVVSTPAVPVFKTIGLEAEDTLSFWLDDGFLGKALVKAVYKDSNTQASLDKPLQRIDLKVGDTTSLSASIEGTKPVQTLLFDTVDSYSAFIEEKVKGSQYLVNEVKFSGYVEGELLRASSASIVFVSKESVEASKPVKEDDNEDDYDTRGQDQSKAKHYFIQALPIIAPLASTILVAGIATVLRSFFEGTYSTIKLSAHRQELIAAVIEKREERVSKFVTQMNNEYHYRFKDLSQLLNAQNENIQLESIKFTLEDNIAQLKVLRDKGSSKGNMEKFIKVHHQLVRYIEGVIQLKKEGDIGQVIQRANTRFDDLASASENLHTSLKDFINQSVVKKKKGLVVSQIETYSDSLNDIFLSADKGNQLLTEEALKKMSDQHRASLEKSFDKIRSIKPRF